MKNILPFLLVAAFGIIVYKKANDLSDQLSYEITDAEIDKSNSSIKKIATVVTIAITNPTKTGFSFTGVQGIFSLDKKAIAKVNWLQNVTIKPMATTTIEIPVNIPVGNFAASLFQTVISFIKNKTLPGVRITGKINTNAGSLNIDTVKNFAVN